VGDVLRRAAIPGVLFLAGLGWQVSGIQSPELAIVFWAVALAWLIAV